MVVCSVAPVTGWSAAVGVCSNEMDRARAGMGDGWMAGGYGLLYFDGRAAEPDLDRCKGCSEEEEEGSLDAVCSLPQLRQMPGTWIRMFSGPVRIYG